MLRRLGISQQLHMGQRSGRGELLKDRSGYSGRLLAVKLRDFLHLITGHLQTKKGHSVA